MQAGHYRILHKLGLRSRIDFILHLPLRYEDETKLTAAQTAPSGRQVLVEAKVERAAVVFRGKRQLIVNADGLVLLEPAPRTVRGARDLLSVALQYGNAFEQGFQAAALKPADFFGNDDVLYLMEDMATGEIRVSILWEWLHKGAQLSEDDSETGAKAGDTFDAALFARLLDEEYEKLLAARDRDVHDDSKTTTLPIAREIVGTYVTNGAKLPWYIDLLNLNLNNYDLANARSRIRSYIEAFERDGTRITDNLDFVV
jgi:malate synthase